MVLPLGINFIRRLGNCPNRRSTAYKTFILFVTFFTYASYHLSRKPISVVKSVLHQNCTGTKNASHHNKTCPSWPPFDHDNYQELLGSLDYAYLFAYAVGMFMSGHVAERVNLRYFLAAGMMLSGIFTAMFGFGKLWNIHSLVYFLAVQVLGGFVQSTGWPSVVTCVANWFGKGRRGFIMGVWNAHTSVGNILGSLIAGAFVDINWAWSFIVPGIIIFSMGVFVFLFLVPHPADIGCELPNHRGREDPEGEVLIKPETPDPVNVLYKHQPPQAINFLTALKIPGVIEFSLCLFFAKLVSYTFLYWLPNYIQNSTPYNPEVAADLSTLFDVGGIAGGIMAGTLSDYTGKRATTCMFMLIAAAPMMFVYESVGRSGLSLNIFLLIIVGFMVNGPYALITTAVSADLGTHSSLHGNAKALATVTAIIDGTGSMGAALGPLLTGLIAPSGWNNVFYMLIGADICAMFFLMRLVTRETKRCCKREE